MIAVLWCAAVAFAVAWLATDDVRYSFCGVVLAAAVFEVVRRTRGGLRAMRELKALAAKIEKENAEG